MEHDGVQGALNLFCQPWLLVLAQDKLVFPTEKELFWINIQGYRILTQIPDQPNGWEALRIPPNKLYILAPSTSGSCLTQTSDSYVEDYIGRKKAVL